MQVNMIKDLEQLANKYQKISQLALQLKQENSVLYNQIDNLQQQLTLLIEDKLELEQKNNFLANQLKQAKQNLLSVIDSINWEDPSDFSISHKDAVLYPANSKLSSVAAAAAAAIGIDDVNMAIDILSENNTDSELSKAVFELENAQNQLNKNLDNNFYKNLQTDIAIHSLD